MVETFKGTPYDTGLDPRKTGGIADYFRPMREALKSGLHESTKVTGVDINTLRYPRSGRYAFQPGFPAERSAQRINTTMS